MLKGLTHARSQIEEKTIEYGVLNELSGRVGSCATRMAEVSEKREKNERL